MSVTFRLIKLIKSENNWKEIWKESREKLRKIKKIRNKIMFTMI